MADHFIHPIVTFQNALPPSDPIAVGLVSRATQFRHERETPFATVYHANGPGGEALAIHVVHPPLLRLALHPKRVVDALREFGQSSTSVEGAPLWSILLEDGRLCYALDWTASDPAVALTRSAAHTPRQLAPAARALCTQLGIWHTIDVIHGAIMPDSLRIDRESGDMLVDDMGVFAALVSGGADPKHIIDGVQALPYASPELVSGRAYDGRSDVYSLGTALYELFTGRPPFGGRTTATMMASVLIEDTSISTSESEHHEADVIAALLRAIEKLPDDRWSGVRDFGNALTGQALEAPEDVPSTTPRSGCGNMAVVLVGIAVFLIGMS